jgi:phosphoglycerate dehydrogenase-like enzyme
VQRSALRHDGAVTLRIALAPAGLRPFLQQAILDGGGALAPLEEAEGLVWSSPLPRGAGGEDLAAILKAHPGIRWVQLPWAGIEPFLEVLDEEHVWSAGQGVYAEPVAEHALALALAGLRDLKARARAHAWGAPSGLSLLGGLVTIVGAGGITRSLVRLLAPFGCDLTIVRRRDQPFVTPAGETLRTLPLEKLALAFEGADVAFLACALTPTTRRCVGAKELAALPPHAWLVNVARGGLVDTDALVDALAREIIGGAALDVTDPEPLPASHPLWRSDRCLITPHVGNTPEMAIPLLSERVRDNVRRRASGQPLLGIVDVKAGY